MNRRNLLTAAAASVMLPGAVMAAGISVTGMPSGRPDAELLTACGEFLRLQREFEAYCTGLPGDMEDDDPAWAMLDPLPGLVEQIVTLRATTAEGHLARARCRAFPWLPQARACQDDPEAAAEDRFMAAELRDLVAMECGAAVTRPPAAQTPVRHPDADLLAACAAFQRADADQAASNAKPGWDEDEIDAIIARWYRGLDAMLAAPDPQTAEGCAALASAARAALMAHASGQGSGNFAETASKEERLAVKALEAGSAVS